MRCYASNRQVCTRTIKATCDVVRMRVARMASAAVVTPTEDFSKKLTLSNEVKDGFVTEHLYYNDTELCECKGKIIGARLIEFQGESRNVIILDQTVMHPQGGKENITVKENTSHIASLTMVYCLNLGHYLLESCFSSAARISFCQPHFSPLL